jgi:hypothetical protein
MEVTRTIQWDEICDEAHFDGEDDLPDAIVSLNVTDGEEIITKAVRDWLSEGEDEDEFGWGVSKFLRGDRIVAIEWRSDRGHLGVTVIIWE